MTLIRETAAIENCSGTSLADILQSALPSENPNSCGSQPSSESSSGSNSIVNATAGTISTPTTGNSSFSSSSFSDSKNYVSWSRWELF